MSKELDDKLHGILMRMGEQYQLAEADQPLKTGELSFVEQAEEAIKKAFSEEGWINPEINVSKHDVRYKRAEGLSGENHENAL